MIVKGVRWVADGGAVNIPIGFIPDHVKVIELGADAAVLIYEWFRNQANEASGKQEGISILEGVTANLADSGGVTAYDTPSVGPTVNKYTVARSTAATARTATADGTFIRPSDTSSADKDAIFECVTAGTGSAEPTWPKGIGEQVLDGTVLWERVNKAVKVQGYKGFSIAAALQTDGRIMYAIATKFDEFCSLGDVDGWPSGVSPSP